MQPLDPLVLRQRIQTGYLYLGMGFLFDIFAIIMGLTMIIRTDTWAYFLDSLPFLSGPHAMQYRAYGWVLLIAVNVVWSMVFFILYARNYRPYHRTLSPTQWDTIQTWKTMYPTIQTYCEHIEAMPRLYVQHDYLVMKEWIHTKDL